MPKFSRYIPRKSLSLLRTPFYVLFCTVAVMTSSQQAFSQTGYSEQLLNTKRIFSNGLAEAIGQPFEGVHTSGGRVEDIFDVKSTGVSTAGIQAAAEDFLRRLNPAQLGRVQFAIDDPEWRNWSNVDVGIFNRQGISLEEMTSQTKRSAWDLMRVSLSAQGLEKTQSIMRTEQRLLELNAEPIRYGEEKYYITIMGLPSATEPWGWQLDGHHLVINFFVLGDQVVMTPAFWGGEPVFTEAGKYPGNVIMQDEQDVGLAFMQSLPTSQQRSATVNPDKTRNDQQAAANADNLVMDYQGLQASQLDSAAKLRLLDLIRVYVGNLRDPHADVTMAEIGEHINDTYFSWIGAAEDDSLFYYRIHSPVILIEFDHQNPVGTVPKNPAGTPTRDHIHTVVRTPNGNDYGKDLLRQHLLSHPH